MFRRAPDGQWWAISPGIYDWKALQSSSFPLQRTALRPFQQRPHHRSSSRSRRDAGRCRGARTTEWAPLNNALGTSLESVLIGDIDHNGVDDILRFRVISTLPPHERQLLLPERGIWEVSWDGRSDWREIKTLSSDARLSDPLRATKVRGFRRLPGRWSRRFVECRLHPHGIGVRPNRQDLFRPQSLRLLTQ